MATFSIIRATATSFAVEVSGLSTAYAYNRDFYWYVSWKDSSSSESYWRLIGSTLNVAPDNASVTYVYRGIAQGYPGAQFYLAVDIRTSGTTDSISWLTTNGYSAASGPTLAASGVTSSTITATVSDIASTSVDRYLYWYRSDPPSYSSWVYYSSQTLASNAQSASYTYTDLSPDATYAVSINIYKAGDTSDAHNFIDWLMAYVTTTNGEEFEWDYAGCTAAGVPIAGSQKSSDYRVYVSAKEWNRLVDRVNEKKSTTISHVSVGTYISAAIVNEVANALGAPTVSAGDYIRAAFFNNLAALA